MLLNLFDPADAPQGLLGIFGGTVAPRLLPLAEVAQSGVRAGTTLFGNAKDGFKLSPETR